MSDILETMREYKEHAETKSERDAFDAVITELASLRARLAPVDDKALVEIAMQAILKETGERVGLWPDILSAAIAVIRPHIEAAERERCASIADAKGIEWDRGDDGCARAIAAAMRRGK